MATPTTFLIKPSIFGNTRLLTVHPDYLSFGPTTITKENIESFRFGVDWHRGRLIMIGRTYRIEVRDHEGHIIRIRLRSIYGIGKKRLGGKYNKIYQALHQAYFNDLGIHYISLMTTGLAFPLGGIIIKPEGISDTHLGDLPWTSVGLKGYYTYFSIFDKSQPTRYRTFDYGGDWNAALLYSVLDYIAKKELTTVSK